MRSSCGWTFASPRFGLRCQKIVVNFVIESFDTWNQKNFPRLNEQHFIDWIFHVNIIKIVIQLFHFLGINFALLFKMSWFLWLVLLYLLFEIVNKIRLDHLANNLLKINCRWHRYELSYSDTDLLLCFRIPMPDQIPLTFGMKYLPKKKVAFRNGIQRNQRYIPISCARNISAMSSNIWLFCLEILLGLTVKRDGWSVYQWLLYSPENQTPHSRQCSQLIFASALMKSSNFWITFCTKWS